MITNISKPTTSVENLTKVNIGETWASITTTYASETRFWSQFASLIGNISRITSSISNVARPA